MCGRCVTLNESRNGLYVKIISLDRWFFQFNTYMDKQLFVDNTSRLFRVEKQDWALVDQVFFIAICFSQYLNRGRWIN